MILVNAASAAAQTLAGNVRDSSGAVLPGVTVEATSPALIEKVRTAVTDSNGQYQIASLPPGTYKLTFSLTGFSPFVHDAIALTGAGVTSINAELRVGTLQESVTVTGDTPVVDVQSARQATVLDGDIVRALPASRSYGNIWRPCQPFRRPASTPASRRPTTSSRRGEVELTRERYRSMA